MWRPSRRSLLACCAAAAVLLPLVLLWRDSLLPASYSMAATGRPDYGGGPVPTAAARPVSSLVAPPDRPPDVTMTLTARTDGARYTLNGTSPGPVIRVEQGQLIQVRLVNESVQGGVTLHWHGVDVPNADDGVAGVTQDAVPVGGEFTYRFVAMDAGTYWYHSHQVSHEQVQRGLLGALVVVPHDGIGSGTADAVALVHLYDGVRTVNGGAGDVRFDAAAGSTVRVRVINTDNGPMPLWIGGAPFRLVAIDGTDVHGATLVTDVAVDVTAGGRANLEVPVPADGTAVRVELGGSAALIVGPVGVPAAAAARPGRTLDPLGYGVPAPLGLDPNAANRRFEYAIGRRPGFLDGWPGVWWTINGHVFPDTPMFMVSEGDVVRMRISNSSGEVHPMHLHGHHAVVLARDGVAATGSPWWFDSLNVENGETYDVAFVADNPGVWMDHCHNLPHARDGLVAHLMYEGVTEPFRVDGHNDPE